MQILKDILYVVAVSALMLVIVPIVGILAVAIRIKEELYWGG